MLRYNFLQNLKKFLGRGLEPPACSDIHYVLPKNFQCGNQTEISRSKMAYSYKLSFLLCVHELECVGDEDISSVDAAALKQAYAGLVTLILEAVKMDCDSSSIRYILYIVHLTTVMK